MTEQRRPARSWYDLATERAAIKGWSVSELARRARVGRPTIYGWRDNLGKPQAKPVNSVADALDVPREQALRLAGIIADEGPPEEQEMPTPEELERLKEHIRDVLGPGKASPLEAALDAALAGEKRRPSGRGAQGEGGEGAASAR